MSNIYPSNLRNYFLKDTLLDYLNIYGDSSLKDSSAFPESNFTQLMFDLGNQYENEIVKRIITLATQHNLTYYTVVRNNSDTTPYKQTKDAFDLKTDIIFQPFLKDWNTGLAGYPDIVISNHAFKTIWGEEADGEYVVIDVKFSNYSQTTVESGYNRFIRAQLAIYNTLLQQVIFKKSSKKIGSKYGYIISKTSDESNLGKLTKVLLADEELNRDIYSAIKWIQLVRKEGKNWCIKFDRPIDKVKETIVKELFPNLGNQYDYPWRGYKTLLAEQFKEVSYLWGIGTKIRETLHEGLVYDFEDECVNEELSNIMNVETNKYKNIDSIIQTLLCESDDIKENCMERIDKIKYMYLDIEGCYQFNLFQKGRQFMTCVGIGQYIQKNNKKFDLETNWEQKIFFIDELDQNKEEKMINQVIDYLKYEMIDSELIILHYTSAERKFLSQLQERGVKFKSVDLAVCFKYFWEKGYIQTFPINNFKLKTIVQKLTDLHYINEDPYKNCKIKSGLEVASIYNRLKDISNVEYRNTLIQEILEYNTQDCKSLYLVYLLLKIKFSLL